MFASRLAPLASAAVVASLLSPVSFQAQSRPGADREQVADARAIWADRGASATWTALKRLNTRASLLMIVAHPDDEDGGTLAYESRGLGARVSLMQLNRGEGGANVMSTDLWDALGLVRTEELLQAGRYYGLDRQYFSTATDYGFSKSLKEALDQWGHDKVLEETVRIVRMNRPLVVCSVFVGGPTDGHGNHATAGMMAQEVFKAAGDPKMFPEQIKAGLLPWTPLKVYARVPFFRTSEKGSYDYANHSWGPLGVTNHVTGKWEPGKVNTTVSIPAGTYDEVAGASYPQISREGLGFQRSQNGGGEVPLPGEMAGMYHRFGSHVEAKDTEESFFDSVDVSLGSIAELAGPKAPAFLSSELAAIAANVDDAMKHFMAQDPSAVAPVLADGMKRTAGLIAQVEGSKLSSKAKYDVLYELRVKHRQFNDALVAALGLQLDADVVPAPRADGMPPEFRRTQTTFQMATPGSSLYVRAHLFSSGKQPLRIDKLTLQSASGGDWSVKEDAAAPATLASGKAVDVRFSAKVPQNEPYTRPYFTRANLGQGRYELLDAKLSGQALAPYPLEAVAELQFNRATLRVSQVVQVISRVEGPGILRYPMPVGPAVSVELSQNAGVLREGQTSFPLSVRVHNNAEGKTTDTVRLKLPEGWTAEPTSAPVSFSQAGEEQSIAFTVTPKVQPGKSYQVTGEVEINGKRYTEGYVTTGYTGLRPYFLYSAATFKAVAADVKVAPNERIGYITGSGDDVPQALSSMGVPVSYLSAQDLSSADLSKYDAILVGVRAYAVRPDLIANNARLLEYVKNGGVLMVQYNTPEFDHNFGPYPYTMTGDPEEVTNEASVVKILDPENPLFTWPNQITAKDFDGWIEERGSKFLDHWDPQYSALLVTHDENQPEQKGGLLYARYGKGIYIYNAYAFYRQLPLGVPGAYRLFANMISLPKNPKVTAGR